MPISPVADLTPGQPGHVRPGPGQRRELEKCKSDKKQKVLGDFFNQFESSPITIPDASQNVDKKNVLTTRKSVSNISSSLINCTSDSFELNIHQTNVQDSSRDFSLNKPILSLHCTANEPKLNLNNSEIIQNSKTSFVKDKIVDIENTLPETTARVTDSSTKSNVQNEYFPNDKALFDNILLSEQKKTDLIYLGPCQPTQSEIIEKEFPKIMNKNERQYAFDSKFYFYINKKDKLSESYKSSWLAYSPRNHYAYCHFCWIFGENEAKKSSWYRGFTDWKHFKDSYSAHAQSKMHLRSSIATFNFKKLKDIKSSLSNQIDDEVKKWKEILTILFDTVRTLCASGLPLRGHRENIGIPGNHGIYLNIIDLISRHNSTLSSHLNSNSKIKYLSKTITNEVLETLALETKSLIIKQYKKAKFFTLLADSTTDVAHLEQMAILLRYVQIDPECEQSIVIKESFIGFYSMNKGDSESICNFMIKTIFEDIGLNKSFMVGQGFDGANVMSGKHGGLQAKLNEFLGEEIYAPYVHCAVHQLNLVLVHAAENNANASIKVFFATLQKIYNYFSKSHSRWKLFLNQTKMNSHTMNMNSIVVENEMDSGISDITSSNNTKKTLKSLSTTRWAARLHAVEA
ncbi:zinc finger MYM-type protein 1-like, partial [Aphis craccivora]